MEFFAKIESLHAMLQWIRDQLTAVPFDSRTLYQIELASEEALVNVIRHAYQDRPEKIEIEVIVVPKSRIEIAIADQGPALAPSEWKEPDLSKNLEEREIGGLGIHLMCQCMDEIRYQRRHHRNILTLIKKIGGA